MIEWKQFKEYLQLRYSIQDVSQMFCSSCLILVHSLCRSHPEGTIWDRRLLDLPWSRLGLCIYAALMFLNKKQKVFIRTLHASDLLMLLMETYSTDPDAQSIDWETVLITDMGVSLHWQKVTQWADYITQLSMVNVGLRDGDAHHFQQFYRLELLDISFNTWITERFFYHLARPFKYGTNTAQFGVGRLKRLRFEGIEKELSATLKTLLYIPQLDTLDIHVRYLESYQNLHWRIEISSCENFPSGTKSPVSIFFNSLTAIANDETMRLADLEDDFSMPEILTHTGVFLLRRSKVWYVSRRLTTSRSAESKRKPSFQMKPQAKGIRKISANSIVGNISLTKAKE